MQETWVWSLGWEYPLEKEIATHSSVLAWKFPWTEDAGRLQSMGMQRVGHDWATSLSLWKICLFSFSVHFKTRLFRFVAVVVCYWIVWVFIYFGYYLLSDILLFRFVAVVVCYWIVWVFIYFGYYLLSDILFRNIFAHPMFSFSFVDGFLCCAEAI